MRTTRPPRWPNAGCEFRLISDAQGIESWHDSFPGRPCQARFVPVSNRSVNIRDWPIRPQFSEACRFTNSTTSLDCLPLTSPNSLIAARDLLLKRRSRRQSWQQAEAKTISQFPLPQQSQQLGSIQIQRIRHDRHAKEVATKPHLVGSELRGPGHERRQGNAGPAIRLHIFREDSKIRRDPLPEARRRAQGVQVLKVDQVFVEKPRVIDDVAQSDVEMPVHALQRADDNAVLGRGHSKNVPTQLS